jgi:anti-anti-sigma regulatory factor
MHESPAFRETVAGCLKRFPHSNVIVDLSDCHYLDSTFMGGMIWLHKLAGETRADRLRFCADSS